MGMTKTMRLSYFLQQNSITAVIHVIITSLRFIVSLLSVIMFVVIWKYDWNKIPNNNDEIMKEINPMDVFLGLKGRAISSITDYKDAVVLDCGDHQQAC